MCDRQQECIWPLTLQEIEATVSEYISVRDRVPGDEQGPCFSRQISMYLAKHVGGWSTPKIARFYNGRHHTTVMYAIEKIELLRAADETVDALLEVLSAASGPISSTISLNSRSFWANTPLLDAVAERVVSRRMRHQNDRDAVHLKSPNAVQLRKQIECPPRDI